MIRRQLHLAAQIVIGTLVLSLGAVAYLPLIAQEVPEKRVVTLEARPSSIDVSVGERAKVEFVALDAGGMPVEDALISAFMLGAEAGWDSESWEIVGLHPGETTLTGRVRRATETGPGFIDVRSVLTIRVRPLPVERIEITALRGALYVDTRVQLEGMAFSTRERRDDVEVHWTSADPEVVLVSPSGLAQALRPGTARVTAIAEGVGESLSIEVVSNPTQRVVIEPASADVRTGDVIHFNAVAYDSAGHAVETQSIEWSAGSSMGQPYDAAYLEADGTFVPNDPGLYRVTAAVGAVSAIVEITAVTRSPRHAIRAVAHGISGLGHATTDLWVFEGLDRRDYTYTGTYSGNVVQVWDVTDPARPVMTDSVMVDGRRVNDVKVNHDATIAVVTSENASTRRNGITLVDIRNPAHPTIITHYTEQLTGGIHNTWIEGDLVYAVNYGTRSIHIIDISDPAQPKTVGRWGLPNEDRFIHDVTIKDGLAYVAYWNDGLIILDVGAGIAGGTPTSPQLVSRYRYRYQLGSESYGNTHHAIPYGNYVFLGDEIFGCAECVNGPRGYVHVIDVSDIEHPHEVAWYRVPEGGAHNMWAENDKLYIAYYQAGLRVLDISGELRGDLYRQGREIGWFMTEDATGTVPFSTFTWGVQPYKGMIYASDAASGLWIVQMEPVRTLVP